MSKIAKSMNVNKNTIMLWIKKYKLRKELTIENGRGRKKILSDCQELFIVDIMHFNKFWKISDLKRELHNLIDLELCDNTLINILKRHCFSYNYRKTKQFLSEKHKNIRLQFALNNYDTNWLNVIFSDESMIVKNQHTGKYWIGPKDDNIIGTFKHPIKRYVWACINSGGIGTIYIFKHILDSKKYIEILKQYLLPIYSSNYIFQQDNDPKHTSVLTSSFIIDNNIKTLVWAPNSPDLNPIENVWNMLKNLLEKDLDITEKNFDQKILDCWNKISFENIFNSISSMHCRICDVIKNNGSHINY